MSFRSSAFGLIAASNSLPKMSGLPQRPVAKVCEAGYPLRFSTAPQTIAAATSCSPAISRCSSCRHTRRSSTRRKISGRKSAKRIFKNYALKSIDAARAKLEEAILHIERNPETVKSITSFPYIRKSY